MSHNQQKTPQWFIYVGTKVPKTLVKSIDKVRKKQTRSDFVREAIKQKLERFDPCPINYAQLEKELTEGGLI